MRVTCRKLLASELRTWRQPPGILQGMSSLFYILSSQTGIINRWCLFAFARKAKVRCKTKNDETTDAFVSKFDAGFTFFFTTLPFQLYGKWRIAPGNIYIIIRESYNNNHMKPFSEYEMFQKAKQR